MGQLLIDEQKIINIAEAVREKTGTTDTLTLDEMAPAIKSIKVAADEEENTSTTVDTADATATADQLLKDRTAYVNGEKITGTLSNIELVAPILTFNQSTGVVTATSTQTDQGFLVPTTKTNTLTIPTVAGKTVTPSTSSQIAVAGGQFLAGDITIAAIPSSYSALKVTVICSTSQPSNPTNTTIWCNSSTAMTDYVLSPTTPTAKSGRVWVKTGASDSISFNAISSGTNEMRFGVLDVQQYNGSSWVSKSFAVYTNSQWKASAVYVIQNSSMVYSGSWSSVALSDYASIYGYKMTWSGVTCKSNTPEAYYCGAASIGQKGIDCSQYSKCSITVSGITLGSKNSCQLQLRSSASGGSATFAKGITAKGTYTFDLSSTSATLYPAVYTYRSESIDASSITFSDWHFE